MEHLDIIRQGVSVWNSWRDRNRQTRPCLHFADLSSMVLSCVNLSNVDLSNANLSNANLSNANLSNANLHNASLRKTGLSNANLARANLFDTNLSGADLRNANLKNANLFDTGLYNANLHNAIIPCISALFDERGSSIHYKATYENIFFKVGCNGFWTIEKCIEHWSKLSYPEPGRSQAYIELLQKIHDMYFEGLLPVKPKSEPLKPLTNKQLELLAK